MRYKCQEQDIRLRGGNRKVSMFLDHTFTVVFHTFQLQKCGYFVIPSKYIPSDNTWRGARCASRPGRRLCRSGI